MTSLVVHHRVRYRTSLEPKWIDTDYAAYNIVKAAKNEPFKGYVDLTVKGARQRFQQNNVADLLDVICNDAAARLSKTCSNAITIVPVPNREGILGSQKSFRTMDMAMRMAQHWPKATASAALRWREVRPKRHKAGGYRDPQVEYDNLAVAIPIAGDVVLFDDFLTSGSQMLAAAKRLSEQGAHILFGLTIGRAVEDHRDPMLAWESEEISWRQNAFEFPPLAGR